MLDTLTQTVIAPSVKPVGLQTIAVQVDSAALDENSGVRAQLQQPASPINVSVVNRAALGIDTLFTNLDIVGQNQAFTLSGIISNSGDANLEPNDSVFIRLAFDENAFQLINPADTLQRIRLTNKTGAISWDMQALQGAPINRYGLTAAIDSLLSKDENNNDPASAVFLETAELTDSIEVVNIGAVSISEAYLGQPGVDSLTVSTQQTVTVFVIPDIVGDFQNPVATLDFPGVFSIDTLTSTIVPGDTIPWTFEIPNPETLAGNTDTLRVRVRARSGVNGAVLRDSTLLKIVIERRGTLVLNGAVVGGSSNNTVSQGQPFRYEAVVTNIGEAGVLPSPAGELTISLGSMLSLPQDTAAVKTFTIGDTVSWPVNVEASAGFNAIVQQIEETENRKRELQQQQTAASQQRETDSRIVLTSTSGDGDVRALDSELTGLYNELSAMIDTSFVRVQITQRPAEANTMLPIDTLRGTVNTSIQIAEEASIRIMGTTVNTNWSTEQVEDLILTIENTGDLVDLRGILLETPPGFEILDGDSIKAINNNTVRWALRAPAVINGDSETGIFRYRVEGTDRNIGVVVRDSSQVDNVTVETKAVLDLTSNSVSITAQRATEFTVQALIAKTGFANTAGTASVKINVTNPSFRLDSVATPPEQSFDPNTGDQVITWNILAPEFTDNTVIGIGFTQIPQDENTLAPATVLSDSVTISVNMISNQLVGGSLNDIIVESSYVQGQANVAVLGLGFLNPNTTEKINLQSFQVTVDEGEANPSVEDVENLISRMEIVTYEFYLTNPDGPANPPDRLGQTTIAAGVNPVIINFDSPDTINAEATGRYVLRLDLADQSVNRNFRLKVSNIDARAQGSGTVDIVDTLGVPLLNSIEFSSSFITILSTDAEQTFRNYPNPFGMNTQIPGEQPGVTRFSFIMNSAGNAELSIYTLSGRLVRKLTAEGLAQGLHNDKLKWDGKNGQGRRVVNGVYVAILRANGETLQTKVAYIK